MKVLTKLGTLVAVCCLSISASAQSFTLTNNQTGQSVQCGSGSSDGGGISPACVSKVADYCNSNTSYARTSCYDKAVAICGRGGPNTGECVPATADYCSRNTSYTRTTCFDQAGQACSGSAAAINALSSSAAVKVQTQLIKHFQQNLLHQ